MHKEEYIFIDLETTGGRPNYDRIIEIGLYHVKNDQVQHVWHRLVNPLISVPLHIQNLTGISNDMVCDQPTFEDLAEELYELLDQKIFVAHNARFDYSFIKNAMNRANISFQAKTLCTVRLSRAAFPHEKGHSLDAITHRYQLQANGRHRALADVELMYAFFCTAKKLLGPENLTKLIKKLIKQSAIPSHLPVENIQSIPARSGIYRFYGDNNALLYIGKSVNLKDRIFSHFSADHSSYSEMKLSQQVKSIDWIETAGELGALLLEAKLIKETMPIYNKRLRRYRKLYTILMEKNNLGYCYLRIVSFENVTIDFFENTFGLFRSKRSAEDKLHELVKSHQLCMKLVGLEKTTGFCFQFQLHRCKGACGEKEPALQYNLRLNNALMSLHFKTWPFKSKVAIREECKDTQRVEFHVIDKWCYLGSVKTEADLYEKSVDPAFLQLDLDIYKILSAFFSKKNKIKNVIQLP